MTTFTEHVYDTSIKRCLEGYNQEIEDWSNQQWFNALGGEIGEFTNVVKKINRHVNGYAGNDEGSGMALYTDMLKKEAADIYLYLVLCQASMLTTGGAIFTNKSSINLDVLSGDGIYDDMPHNLFSLEQQASELQILNGKILELILNGLHLRHADLIWQNIQGITISLLKIASISRFDIKEASIAKFNATSAKINCDITL